MQLCGSVLTEGCGVGGGGGEVFTHEEGLLILMCELSRMPLEI